MRQARIFVLFLFVSLSLLAQERVTLEECRAWARVHYPLIHQYGLIDQTEQYNLSNAAKSWLPQFAVHAQATYQSDVTQLPFDTEKIASILPGFTMPTVSKDQYKITAELNQTIWDGGMVRSAREISRAEATASREQLEAEMYALVERVDQLYFGVLLQDELLRQNELLQYELGVNIERIDVMIRQGVANLSDRESLEVEVLKTQQNAVAIHSSRKAYLQMLAAFTGKSLDEAILERPLLPGFDRSIAINRPELKALDAQALLMDAQYKQLHAGLMPRLGAFVQGGYGRPGLNMLEDSFNPYYIAGLRFSWNLGNFYTVKDNRRKIETNIRSLALQRETFLFNTRLQLIGQDGEVQKIKEQIEADEEIIRLRSRIKRAAEVKLENGVISVSDLIREINAEDLAKQAAATRQVQYLLAVYRYEVMRGEEIE